tara:strand:- start:244 stop:708 length:465 start_codon:yes stop_codon:yes gene_type:complete
MILNKLNPIWVGTSLKKNINEYQKYITYKKIIYNLNTSGKLDEIGFKTDEDANLYLGVNLNPELLLYSDASQEPVELKMISEKMLKYNDFLTKEGILDVITVDYDRVKNDSFYGYVLQIKFNFSNFKRREVVWAISYFTILLLASGSLLLSLLL